MDKLPNDIYWKIFSLLDHSILFISQFVSKKFYLTSLKFNKKNAKKHAIKYNNNILPYLYYIHNFNLMHCKYRTLYLFYCPFF